MEAKMMLWLVVATCLWSNSMSSPLPTLLRSVVNETAQTYQIFGPNGYCLDVKDGDYSDGTPVILWSCNSSQASQKWSFDYNGTITSNGKCLTADGDSEGSKILIHNCDTASRDSKSWMLRSNGGIGNIVHKKKGLVLTAIFGKNGTGLTLETNIFSSYQTWATSYNPKERGIISPLGAYRTCMRVLSNSTLLLDECDVTRAVELFYRYPDGTIRSYSGKENRWRCLSYNDLTAKQVSVESCGLGPSSERWVFTSNDTILNERTNLVMERTTSYGIIVNSPTGNQNQRWKWRDFPA